ncbi:MAG: OsmC family protein [Candidatus Bipolaricaulaceae bacterium]
MKLVAYALHEENMSFSVVIRNHKVRADLTPDKGGADSGPTPPELLLGALAACSGIYARIFAVREGLASVKIEVAAEAEMDEPPAFLRNFVVRVKFPGLPPEKEEKLRAFVEHCLVGQTLSQSASPKLIVER